MDALADTAGQVGRALGVMDQEHAGAPALATFTEAQRQQAMARFAVLRPHLDEGVPRVGGGP